MGRAENFWPLADKAFVVLKPGFTTEGNLKRDIQDFVRSRLAAHEYPREIEFVSGLPMTATGKIIRRNLRKQQGGMAIT